MIRVARGDELGGSVQVDAVLRSVGSDLEALTAREMRIARGAGERALLPLRQIGDAPIGGAFVTPGGDLPVSFIIHVVIRSPEEAVSPAGVRRALTSGLRQASEWGVERLGLLPLGTGAGNLDVEAAARLMVETVREHRASHEQPDQIVMLVDAGYEEEVFRRASEAVRGSAARRDEPGAAQ